MGGNKIKGGEKSREWRRRWFHRWSTSCTCRQSKARNAFIHHFKAQVWHQDWFQHRSIAQNFLECPEGNELRPSQSQNHDMGMEMEAEAGVGSTFLKINYVIVFQGKCTSSRWKWRNLVAVFFLLVPRSGLIFCTHPRTKASIYPLMVYLKGCSPQQIFLMTLSSPSALSPNWSGNIPPAWDSFQDTPIWGLQCQSEWATEDAT